MLPPKHLSLPRGTSIVTVAWFAVEPCPSLACPPHHERQEDKLLQVASRTWVWGKCYRTNNDHFKYNKTRYPTPLERLPFIQIFTRRSVYVTVESVPATHTYIFSFMISGFQHVVKNLKVTRFHRIPPRERQVPVYVVTQHQQQKAYTYTYYWYTAVAVWRT